MLQIYEGDRNKILLSQEPHTRDFEKPIGEIPKSDRLIISQTDSMGCQRTSAEGNTRSNWESTRLPRICGKPSAAGCSQGNLSTPMGLWPYREIPGLRFSSGQHVAELATLLFDALLQGAPGCS